MYAHIAYCMVRYDIPVFGLAMTYHTAPGTWITLYLYCAPGTVCGALVVWSSYNANVLQALAALDTTIATPTLMDALTEFTRLSIEDFVLEFVFDCETSSRERYVTIRERFVCSDTTMGFIDMSQLLRN